MRNIKFNLGACILILFVAVAAILLVSDLFRPAPEIEGPTFATLATEDTTPVETTEATTEPTAIATEPTMAPTEPAVVPTEPTTDTIKYEYVEVIDPLLCDTSSELEMLACTIYQEAGGDGSCDLCRYRVADIVLNRIETGYWGDSMYDVLTAHRQYGRFYWTGVKWDDRAKNPSEAEAVSRAYAVAQDVLNGSHSDLYGEGYIWQAEFVQGSSGFWCCGHYFGKN